MNFSEAFLISLIAGSKKNGNFDDFLLRNIQMVSCGTIYTISTTAKIERILWSDWNKGIYQNQVSPDLRLHNSGRSNEFEIVFDKIKKNKLPECFSNWYLGNVHCDNRNGWVSLLNFELILRFKCQFLFTLRPIIETHSDQRWNRVLVSVIQVWILKSENNYGHKIYYHLWYYDDIRLSSLEWLYMVLYLGNNRFWKW